jgi:hypothetical protein
MKKTEGWKSRDSVPLNMESGQIPVQDVNTKKAEYRI